VKILDSGESEWLKTTVHTAAWMLSVVMALYNTAAWNQRRQRQERCRHLCANAVLYWSLTLFETYQVRHHLLK
jgi:hypothetical protein